VAQAVDERVERFRRDYLPRLVEKFRPTKVLVFGSRARGDALKHSDLDLLIVADAFASVRWLDRSVRVLDEVPLPFGAELLCYTPEEYARKVEEFGIVRTATAEGLELLV
jgi:predicted nucleotidyltransferase